MAPQSLWTDWQFEPAVVAGVLIAALLYARGAAYARAVGLSRRIAWWRVACFGGGLLAVVVALESPIDALSDTYLTVHMVQHLLLIFIAAPLLLWGAPLTVWWRAVPLETRRRALHDLLLHGRVRHAGHRLGRVLTNPHAVWLIFSIDFVGWHAPVLYSLALKYQPIHDLEHMCFLGTALLFWAQIIPSVPLRPALGYVQRALYLFGAGVVMNFVAMALIFVNWPLYSYYAQLTRPAGMPSALIDQATAGGVMNVGSALVLSLGFCVLLWLWLEDADADAEAAANALADQTPIALRLARRRKARGWSPGLPQSIVINGVHHAVRPLDARDGTLPRLHAIRALEAAPTDVSDLRDVPPPVPPIALRGDGV